MLQAYYTGLSLQAILNQIATQQQQSDIFLEILTDCFLAFYIVECVCLLGYFRKGEKLR
jgi:cytosine/uracil/thiamine/allantoin permease